MNNQTRLQAYPKNGTISIASGSALVYVVPHSTILNISSADQIFTVRIDDAYELIGKQNKRYGFPDAPFTKVELINTAAATLNVQVEIGAGNVESDDVTITGTIDVDVQAPLTITTTADNSIAANTTEQILAVNADRKEAIVTNLYANTDPVRVGDASTGAARGIELSPGQSITLSTTASIYVHNTKASAQSVAILEAE